MCLVPQARLPALFLVQPKASTASFMTTLTREHGDIWISTAS
jgi:hypothetical protein